MQLMKGGSIMAVPSWFDEYTYLQSKLNQLISAGQTQYSNVTQVKAAIEAAGMSVYQHFEKFSLAERTSPNTYFNTQEYLEAKAAQLNTAQGVTTWTADKVALEFQNGGFTNAYEHFSKYGWAEGVNPSNSFDVSSYLEAKAAETGKTVNEVKAAFEAAGLDPIAHYETYGKSEGITVTEVPADEQVTPDSSGSTGKTFTLTNSTITGSFDNKTGTSGNDSFIAGPATLETGDVLAGGAGTDKLEATSNVAAIVSPTMSGIEQIFARTFGNHDATYEVNLANATGVTEAWANMIEDTGANGNDNLKFSSLSKSVVAGIKGGASVAANRANVEWAFNDVTGSADTATLILDGASVATVTMAGVETINIKSQNGNSTIGTSLTAPAATKLIVTGDKNISIAALDVADANNEIDASALTGDLSVKLENQAVNVTYKGGKGNDKVNMNGTLAAGDDIDGGEGTNTIAGITAAAQLTAATGKLLKNFQVFDAAGTTGAYDMDLIVGAGSTSTINSLVVSADLGGATTIDNLVKGANVTINASTTAGLTINQKGAGSAGSNSDTLTFELLAPATGGNITVNALTAANIETVTVKSTETSGVTSGHTLTQGTFADASTVKFEGNEQLTVTNLTAAAAAKIDASAMTDKFIMSNAANGGGIQLVLGGSADDTLISNDVAGSTLQGNGGADTIILGGAGNAEIVKYAAQTDSTGTKYDKITNFTTNEDDIDLSAFGFTGAAQTVFTTTKASVDNITQTFTISSADATGFFNNSGGNRGVAFATNGTDGVVFVDANKDGNWDAATDMAIYLVGVTAFATADVIFA